MAKSKSGGTKTASKKSAKAAEADEEAGNGSLEKVLNPDSVRPNIQAFVDWVEEQGGPKMNAKHAQVAITAYKRFQKSPAAVEARTAAAAEREEAKAAREAAREEKRAAAAKRAEEREERRAEREKSKAERAAKSKKTAAAASAPKKAAKATAGKATAKKAAAKKSATKKKASKAAF